MEQEKLPRIATRIQNFKSFISDKKASGQVKKKKDANAPKVVKEITKKSMKRKEYLNKQKPQARKPIRLQPAVDIHDIVTEPPKIDVKPRKIFKEFKNKPNRQEFLQQRALAIERNRNLKKTLARK